MERLQARVGVETRYLALESELGFYIPAARRASDRRRSQSPGRGADCIVGLPSPNG